MKRFPLPVLAFLVAAAPGLAQPPPVDNAPHFEGGMGLTLGTDLGDLLRTQYDSVSGFTDFLQVDAAVDVPLGGLPLSLVPRFRMLLSRTEVQTVLEGYTNTKVTYVLLPGGSLRLWVDPARSRAYLSGDLAAVSPGSDFTFLEDLEGDGLSVGGSFGVCLTARLFMEIGYHKVPVKLPYHPEEIDFGGVSLLAKARF